jgi:hypothetical protein
MRLRKDSPDGLYLPGGLGAIKPALPPTPDHPGYWRRVLTVTYAHLQRKEERSIKPREGKGIKRVNINIPTDLHNAFKSTTAAQGLEMTVVLLEFIEKYVVKNGPAPPKQLKSRRA